MEGWSVAVATARGMLVGRQEYCSCGRQLPEGRRGREWSVGEGGSGVEKREGV